MNLSYWEYKTWLSYVDYTVVGSGIVGLNCALQLRKKHPKAKILVLEKGVLPQGASTKNAGFACFGSISEILSDLEYHSEQEVINLVKERYLGIQLLRETLGDKNIDYQQLGGHELFLNSNEKLFNFCSEQLPRINKLLFSVFHQNVFKKHENSFNFNGIKDDYITHTLEGQVDTGKMMQALLKKVLNRNITVLNAITVENFSEDLNSVFVKTNQFEFKTKKLFVATNGFASQLLNEHVSPARAQVLITKPIKNLQIKGTFHLDEGYYYFRNIDDRILLGGGRNLDFKQEETIELGQTQQIQTRLEKLLKTVILPDKPFEIDRRWSGIMGIGRQKKPIIKSISSNVFCGVRLGGMGIAIGSKVGEDLANTLD